MAVSFGNSKIKELYFGNVKMKGLYFGNINLWAKPWQKPTYTGQHIFGSNETYEWIECNGSGELTVSEGEYILFMVGGGGSSDSVKAGNYSGGSGGGYTLEKVQVFNGKYTVLVGAADSPTSIVQNTFVLEAKQGEGSYDETEDPEIEHGGNGGSGGGALQLYGSSSEPNSQGGSDGSDGKHVTDSDNAKNFPGKGQNSTTRSFTNKLTGGGGGGARYFGFQHPSILLNIGGEGGGGTGGLTFRAMGYPKQGTEGTPNTGGGAGGLGGNGKVLGGSGLLILGWKKVK